LTSGWLSTLVLPDLRCAWLVVGCGQADQASCAVSRPCPSGRRVSFSPTHLHDEGWCRPHLPTCVLRPTRQYARDPKLKTPRAGLARRPSTARGSDQAANSAFDTRFLAPMPCPCSRRKWPGRWQAVTFQKDSHAHFPTRVGRVRKCLQFVFEVDVDHRR